MAAIATITASQTALKLDSAGRGEHHFTVTNVTDRRIQFGFRVIADSGPPGAVFGEGDDLKDRTLGPNETTKLVVHIAVPNNTPRGQYPLRLRAYDTTRPGDLFTDGPTEMLEVSGGKVEEPDRKIPWMVIAVVAAVIVIGGAVGAYFFLRDGGDAMIAVPDVTTKPFDQANAAMTEKGFAVSRENVESKQAAGTVVGTRPPAGQELENGGTVTLLVSTGSQTFNRPMYKGHRLDWCLKWGQHCGAPASTAWCRTEGFQGASANVKADDIGSPNAPTFVMGDDKLCTDRVCDGFESITCSNSVQPDAVRVNFLAEILRDNSALRSRILIPRPQ